MGRGNSFLKASSWRTFCFYCLSPSDQYSVNTFWLLGKTEDIFFYFVLYISCWLGLVVSCPCMVLLSSSWLQMPCVHAACLPPSLYPENTQPLQEERSERLHVAVVSALLTCSNVPEPWVFWSAPLWGLDRVWDPQTTLHNWRHSWDTWEISQGGENPLHHSTATCCY